MQLTQKHKEYWGRNLKLTGVLLFVWFVFTFVAAFFARELNTITFLGFPLGFYNAAQGALILRPCHEQAGRRVRRARGR